MPAPALAFGAPSRPLAEHLHGPGIERVEIGEPMLRRVKSLRVLLRRVMKTTRDGTAADRDTDFPDFTN